MDLDNFEFRPLTKGLGFDKNTEESQAKRPASTSAQAPAMRNLEFQMPKEDFRERNFENQDFEEPSFRSPEPMFEVPNKTPVSRSLKKMLDSLPPSVDFIEDKQREFKLKAPITPSAPIETPVYQPEVKAPIDKNRQFDVTLDNSLSQAFPKEEVSKRFYHQMVTPLPQFKEVTSSFASAAIDSLIVLGLASLFVVSLIAITRVDIIAMLTNQELGFRTMLELGLLYFGVTLFYFMLSRGLFGSTLGDWAFDVQLGLEKERSHIMYPFQVVFRTLMILLTGIFIVPILSVAFGKDIAYYFSGLKLYGRQY